MSDKNNQSYDPEIIEHKRCYMVIGNTIMQWRRLIMAWGCKHTNKISISQAKAYEYIAQGKRGKVL